MARSTDKAHGRVEHRTLESTTILTVHQDWPGLKQGFRVRRWGIRQGKPYEEVVHGITSLPVEKADAKRLLALVRSHWRIENSLHYVRDVTLGEDASRVRCGAAPQVLAALRNVAVYLLKRLKTNYAEATRRLAAQFPKAIDFLLSPM